MLEASNKNRDLKIREDSTHLIQCLTKNYQETSLEIALQEKRITPAAALQATHISELRKTQSDKAILLSIRAIILNTAQTLKYAEKMTTVVATTLAADVMELFKNESLEDVLLMFKMARQGKLGKTDGRLDADIVFKVLVPNYMLYKAELREKQYQQEKKAEQERQRSEPVAPIPEKYKKKLDEILHNFGKPKEEPERENHHHMYLRQLRSDVKKMELAKLQQRAAEMKGNPIMREAVAIIKEEINTRQNNDNQRRSQKQV